MPATPSSFAGERLAKVIARAGLCSRRDAELWIKDGRVAVNGKVIRTPAFNVTGKDQVKVDGEPLVARQGTRVWLYHKPSGLVVTEKDPEGRPTIFDTLEAQGLPRVVSVGRLDINTEGLLLLTNDGGLKRVLELPATGWLRRYRVRAFGTISQPQLDALKDGLEFEGVKYGPIEAILEREQGSNVWLILSLREGKNREVKNVLSALGLKVNRLIRVSFGPFQLGELPVGGVEVVKARVLRQQLGDRLANEAGVDFDSELPEPAAITLARKAANPAFRAAAPGKEEPKQRRRTGDFRFADRTDKTRGPRPPRRDDSGARDEYAGPPRKIFNADGTETVFEAKTYGKKPPRGAAGGGDRKPFGKGPPRDFGDRPKRDFGDKPRGSFGDRPKRAFGDKPRGEGADRPKRPYSGRPAADGAERPKRDYGDRPKRPYSGRPAADGAVERPKHDYGDRPKRPYSGRPAADGAERPKRDYGDRPKRPYSGHSAAGGAERPKRDSGDRPKRPYSGRPPVGDGAAPPKREYGDRPKRPYNGRPATGRAPAEGVERPKRSFGDKPHSPRPAGDKPFAKRPRGSGPTGDRPRRPRPPKA